MIDFSKYETKKKSYSGANGSKKSIMIGDELYMLKLPSHADKNPALSYANSPISEYISSFVFKLVGISCQETILGCYTYKGKKRLAVACKDFTYPNYQLYDFASLRNQIVDSKTGGHSTELKDIIDIFNEQEILNPDDLKRFFYDVFVIDSLLGNFDRHNGNWGYLYDIKTDEAKIAPVYDNGSSLFPQADDKLMKEILRNKNELNRRIYSYPLSAITIDGKKINYYDYLTSLKDEEMNESIIRLVPLIDINKINEFIDNIDVLSKTQNSFYKTIISKRYEEILNKTYKKLK